jgi:ArsR family transcriptional regulator, lead/cadmium/zinc/bismuth-responsive transcriptional repressor
VHLVPLDRTNHLRNPGAVCDALAAQSTVNLDQLAETFAALADRSRLRLLVSLLQSEELCVADLSVTAGLSVSATSHALAQLHRRGVVRARREGRYIYYRAAETNTAAVLRELASLPRQAGLAARP